MSAKANPKLIGAFVVGGFALVIAGMITFASVQFFATRLPIVMYFTGDLTGLDVGAPVHFRGVRVGTVTNVVMRFNVDDRTLTIPVFAEIESERFHMVGDRQPRHAGENLPVLIQRGMRAQLASQSLVTGKLLVQVDFHPDTEVKLVGADPGFSEVPTIPSEMDQLRASLEGLMDSFRRLPLPQLIEDTRGLIRTLDRTVQQVRVEKLVAVGEETLREYGELASSLNARTGDIAAEAALVLRDARGAIGALDGHIGEVARGVKSATAAGEAALKRADGTLVGIQALVADARPMIARLQRSTASAELLLANANSAIEPGSPIYRELVQALREISGTARSIRALADELERNPNSVLFGKASARGR